MSIEYDFDKILKRADKEMEELTKNYNVYIKKSGINWFCHFFADMDDYYEAIANGDLSDISMYKLSQTLYPLKLMYDLWMGCWSNSADEKIRIIDKELRKL